MDARPDFLGNELVCLDANGGTQLWKRDIHVLDLLPEDQRDAVGADRNAYLDWLAEFYPVYFRWHRAGPRGKTDWDTEGVRLRYEAAARAMKAYCPDVPLTQEALVADEDWHGFAKNYVNTMIDKVRERCFPEQQARRERLTRAGFIYNPWFGQGSFVGSAFPTPVSDGKHVYVVTLDGVATCFDLAGKEIWKHRYYDLFRTTTTPVIAGDLLVYLVRSNPRYSEYSWVALDKATGEQRWQTLKPKNALAVTYPTHMTLASPDGAGDLDVLYCPSGQVLRLRDGVELATDLGNCGNYRPLAVEGDIVVIENGEADGGNARPVGWKRGTVAFRLVAESQDKVVAKTLWERSGEDRLSRMVARDGILYGFSRLKDIVALDLRSGKELCRERNLGVNHHTMIMAHHMPVIAGNTLFALHWDGQCLAVDLGKDGRNLRAIALNHLGKRPYYKNDFFNQGSQIFANGDRLYIRSYTDLYCIGPALEGVPGDDPAVVEQIRKAGSVEAVTKYLSDDSAQYRFEAAKRVAALGAAITDATSGLGARLVERFRDDGYGEIRAAALKALMKGDPEGKQWKPAFIDALNAAEFSNDMSPLPPLHLERTVHQFDAEMQAAVRPVLAGLLKDAKADRSIRRGAAYVLGACIGDDADTVALLKALLAGDRDASVQMLAFKALMSNTPDRDKDALLLHAAQSIRDGNIRMLVIRQAYRRDPPVEGLVDWLIDTTKSGRENLVQCLYELQPDEKRMEALMAVLKDGKGRHWAAHELLRRRMGRDEEAVAALLDVAAQQEGRAPADAFRHLPTMRTTVRTKNETSPIVRCDRDQPDCRVHGRSRDPIGRRRVTDRQRRSIGLAPGASGFLSQSRASCELAG